MSGGAADPGKDRGPRIHGWIMEQLGEGRTVYVQTYLRTIEIKPKHRELVRLRGSHCEVARGRAWDSINYASRITAR